MNLFVHKRYTKAPKIHPVSLKLEIHLTDYQVDLLKAARKMKPLIIGKGYHDFLKDMGVFDQPTEIVMPPGRGWKPKYPFGIDFGMPEPLALDPEIGEEVIRFDWNLKERGGEDDLTHGTDPVWIPAKEYFEKPFQ